MSKFILSLLFCLTLNNTYAFDEINGNKIVLITSKEYEDNPKQVEVITQERAENACALLGKSLIDYNYREIKQDNIYSDCDYDGCISKSNIETFKIPAKTHLQPVNYKDMEQHYHDGGATVAIITLGLIPIIISYPARVATSITCGEMEFTTN